MEQNLLYGFAYPPTGFLIPMPRICVFLFGLSLFLGGCDPSLPGSNPTDPSAPPQPPEFSFETCKNVHVRLQVEDDQGNPVPRAPISVLATRTDALTGNALEGTLIEGAPGDDGTVSALISVPVTQEQLIARTTVSGSAQRQPVNIVDGVAEHTFTVSSTSNASGSPGLTLYQPADNFNSTMVFEDLWPTEGDLDVNDIVIDYRFEMPATTSGQISAMEAMFITRASGTILENGFGFMMPIDPSLVGNVSGSNLQEGIVTTRSNGTEANTDNAVVVVYDNVKNLFARSFVNTRSDASFLTPDTLQISVDLTQPVDTSALGTVPFNPFIFVRGLRSREVHLSNQPPTSQADRDLFGTGEDTTDPSTDRYYLSGNNLPWGLNLCNGFIYPLETTRIENTYLHFVDWVDSGGQEFQDWYTNTSDGYRNESNLYTKGLAR